MYFTILCFLLFMDLSILVVVLGLLGIQRWLLETVLQAQVVASGIGANVRDPWMCGTTEVLFQSCSALQLSGFTICVFCRCI